MVNVCIEYLGTKEDKIVEDWVRENCRSFIDKAYCDMSDISSWKGPDDLMCYRFDSESDAILFKLRWA